MVVRVSYADVYVRLQRVVTLRRQLGNQPFYLRRLLTIDWFILVRRSAVWCLATPSHPISCYPLSEVAAPRFAIAIELAVREVTRIAEPPIGFTLRFTHLKTFDFSSTIATHFLYSVLIQMLWALRWLCYRVCYSFIGYCSNECNSLHLESLPGTAGRAE